MAVSDLRVDLAVLELEYEAWVRAGGSHPRATRRLDDQTEQATVVYATLPSAGAITSVDCRSLLDSSVEEYVRSPVGSSGLTINKWTSEDSEGRQTEPSSPASVVGLQLSEESDSVRFSPHTASPVKLKEWQPRGARAAPFRLPSSVA